MSLPTYSFIFLRINFDKFEQRINIISFLWLLGYFSLQFYKHLNQPRAFVREPLTLLTHLAEEH